jgi:hypothetical protein
MSLPAPVEQKMREIVAEEVARAIPTIVEQVVAALQGGKESGVDQ